MNEASTQAQPKPSKIQAVAILTLISGVLNILGSFGVAIYVAVGGVATLGLMCLCIPIPILMLVSGVLEILYAIKLLPDPIEAKRPDTTVAVLQIITIVGGNIVGLAAGAMALAFYNDPEVKSYFDWRSRQLG